MHKAAIITPRASTASASASATASSSSASRGSRAPPPRSNSLLDAFSRQSQRTTSALKMRPDHSRRRVERGDSDAESMGSCDDDDDHPQARRPNSSHLWRERRRRRDPQSSRHTETSLSGLGKKILLQSRRNPSDAHEGTPSTHLARSILNPSTKRRGPRLSFDDDSHENDDDDEMMMLGEEMRRKKNRVWEGARGQLDLIPMQDWEDDRAREEKDRGWTSMGPGSTLAKGRGKKPLEMLGDNQNVGNRHRAQESKKFRSENDDRPISASPSEPDTENDELFPPITRSNHHMESQRSFADSSESDAGEYLQQRLVGGAGEDLVPSSSSNGDILVCDSDEETVDQLAYQFGRGGVDDSGFAEYNDDQGDEGRCDEQGELGMILPSSQPRSDEATLLDPAKKKGMTLERSESSILMPPPPVPVRHQARGASALAVKANEVVPSRPKEQNSFEEIETQWALHSPIKARPSSIPSIIPNRPSTWSSLDAAWQGARPLTPPPPPEPRQANLFEFFPKTQQVGRGEDDEDDEDLVIADSQPGSSIPLGQMRAFQAALITTREMGRKTVRCGEGLGGIDEEEEEEIKEEEEEEEEEEEVMGEVEVEVPSSDQEDGPWSPLGSPVRMRFPRCGMGKEVEVVQLQEEEEEEDQHIFEGKVEYEEEEEELETVLLDLPPLPSFPPSSQMSSTQRDRIKSRAGTVEREEQGVEEQGEREETQWESYWTLETVEPSPFHALMDDDDEDEEDEL
ncbi:BQ2448_3373 [Microbotryum intermedium]|uniref:BQ2448_3373 protein n=1 Tax=Microbotryum intermedium TaxID=269621 RepID=A0A238FES9_9BASI|nr:BQ2448_3373 [Microbotryum intermedium]